MTATATHEAEATRHEISIHCEPPSRSGALVTNGGHRARCSCGWWSDCYAMMTDTERAIEVHLRRVDRKDFETLIARSSIGRALDDIKKRGIDAHLVDLERELNPRRRHAKRQAKRVPKELSEADKAFMRGFGAALASIWRCHHDGQMVRQLIRQNNFTVASFRGVGLLDADYEAIQEAARR
ncbi:MAG TPA: hypothetical protein VLE97_08650 [Gaiellaceae bacterium]|nr:hypothetical protein [Gaiellaceae bacterium]